MAARVLVGLLALSLLPLPAAADPISWSPANSWHKKREIAYLGYNGRKWDDDYGVVRGRCDTAAVGAAIDGREGRAVASMVGAAFARDMDDRDRACIGHALELTGRQRTVVWKNGATGVGYQLTPTRNFRRNGVPCREFTTRVSANGRIAAIYGAACRRGDGEWVFAG